MTAVRLTISSICIMLAANHGFAQSTLETCRQAGDDKARIACLEGAVSALEGQLTRQSKLPPTPAAATVAEDLGAEQVKGEARDNAKAKQRVTGTIRRHSFDGFGRVTVTLDNDQIWRQLEGDSSDLRNRIPDNEPVQVVITRSRFGGYRMVITPSGKTIRVRRQQ